MFSVLLSGMQLPVRGFNSARVVPLARNMSEA